MLRLWNEVLSKNEIELHENSKVESVTNVDKHFVVKTQSGENYTSRKILLVIGRRGSPRKLNVPGEDRAKVAYRLLEPELIRDQNILIVGGGDSAIESALLLSDNNKVTLSYRSDVFGRLKPKNNEKIKEAITENRIKVLFNSNLISIDEDKVLISLSVTEEILDFKNDLVYIFAGGELPTQFLEKIGIQITKKFGEAILKHEN